MRSRLLGRSGIEVSEIGLGGHREGVEDRGGIARTARFFLSAQDRARVVGRAIDGGATYFDTTFGCEIESLGESLRILGRRDGLLNLGDCTLAAAARSALQTQGLGTPGTEVMASGSLCSSAGNPCHLLNSPGDTTISCRSHQGWSP